MGKDKIKRLFRGIGAGLLAVLVIAGVFLGGILLEIPGKEKESRWVVEEEKEPVTLMQAANMSDVSALSRLFGAPLPGLAGQMPRGEARNVSFDGQNARRVVLLYEGFQVEAVRPAEAAALLLKDELDVQLRSDLTVMNLPATLAGRGGAFCAYFADSTAAYAVYAPAAEETVFLELLKKLEAVQ